MKDIQIVDIDYTGKNALYKKTDTVDLTKISGNWIVPEEGPFYKENLRVIKGGLDVAAGSFKAVEGVADLTEATGRGVYLYIELSDELVAGKGTVEVIYQKVGTPVISVKKLIDMLEDMISGGGSANWVTEITGKPATFFPSDHWHDIKSSTELIGYGGLVELFTMFTNDQVSVGGNQSTLLKNLQKDLYDRLDYVNKLRWAGIINHDRNQSNPHGVTASDVGVGNIPNYFTATPQQDGDGDRSDLFSTPAGLKRVIDEASPASEDYIIQSELPFGYYGSGIYLPPPITGSFEGLGSDVENSAFVVEGNGWVVSLFRAYDGRVRNLYYAYNKDPSDRDQINNPWVDTYVQYQHPTITAANKTPNTIISGSNGQVIMIGDQPSSGIGITGSGNWWVGLSNSTFDPNSHSLKPVNMDAIIADLATLTNVNTRPGNFTIAALGNWVYLLATVDSINGDDAANTGTGQISNNWQTVMFRVPIADLSDSSKTTITFTRVNVTYDTLNRDRRTNQNTFIPQKRVFNSNGLITSFLCKFNQPVTATYINRKKQIIIVPNPANPSQARIKIIMGCYSTYRDPNTGAGRSYQPVVIVGFDWNVETNTLTIDSNWDMPTYDILTGNWSSPTTRQLQYAIGGTNWDGMFMNFANTTGSWIPGVGYLIMRSAQSGSPPFIFRYYKFNRDGNIAKDFSDFFLPNDWKTTAGVGNIWDMQFRMRSPFGVAGFPRLYSDLYSLTTGVRSSPIEIFTGEDEAQQQQVFYRITEGGAGDNYILRDALQSDYINKPIWGRLTNSNFGTVTGINFNIGYANRPKRKTASSRQVGLFSYARRNVSANPGASYDFTMSTKDNGAISKIVQETDGSLIINLDMDYTLDSLAKVITAKTNKAKQVRLPKSFWVDSINTALGTDASKVIDIVCSFYIASTPGSGGDQPYSFWSVIYHTTDAPTVARSIVGMFNWEVASTGSDGIRVLRVTNLQYPFKSYHDSKAELKPGTGNILISNYFELNADNTWEINLLFGLQVRQQHIEILDFETEGNGNMEMAWFPGPNIRMTGDNATTRLVMRRRNNAIVEGSVFVTPISGFNQYERVLCANPQIGWLQGVNAEVSGGAMNLMEPWNGTNSDQGVVKDKYVMYGATYVEGNWSIFINADVLVTFNGYSMNAKQTNWDLRDLTDVYKDQIFYIYCVMNGSSAFYEVTKTLRHHNAAHVLVAKVTTGDLGISKIESYQNFSISGFPITRTRDMGIPVSSGAVTEEGTYQFLKRSELYK